MNLTMESAAVTTENQEAFMYARVISQLPILTQFMRAAVELDVFDIIAKNGNIPVSASQIADLFPKHDVNKTPTLLDRMLSLFVSFSLLEVTQKGEGDNMQRLYTLSPTGKHFVKNNVEGTLATFLLFSSQPIGQVDVWPSLKDAILEGVDLCQKTYGLKAFQVMSPETSKVFNKAMSEVSTLTLTGLLGAYKGLDEISTLVDIGGGIGTSLKIIISMNPRIKGINFDMPHIVQNAPTLSGITHVGGDMFASIPKGDAIFLKNVLHNWGDENCVRILKLCYDAIPVKGKVIIVEGLLPGTPAGNVEFKDVFLRDATMFILPEGKERTREQFINLSRATGFFDAQFISNYGSEWIIEFHK